MTDPERSKGRKKGSTEVRKKGKKVQSYEESDIGSYGYHYRKHLPISNWLTFIAPDLR